MTALRRAIRVLRYVNETLVLVLQALFPLPTHDDPARRQTRSQTSMPTSLPSWNTPALAVAVLALGRAARGHGARSWRHRRGRGPCGSRAVACPVRPRPAAGRAGRPRRRQLRGRPACMTLTGRSAKGASASQPGFGYKAQASFRPK